MVHYISAFSQQKNIGGAINAAISQLNSDPQDWIVNMDMDILWLRPDSRTQLETILSTTDYHLLGPLTNRLYQRHQLVKGAFDLTDIRDHITIANCRHEIDYGQVVPTREILAAFCLCFRVETWQKIGGFRENSLQFDQQFNAVADRLLMKKGIMSGIYLYHLYRSWSPNPKEDINHLMP
jgi:GT2 family glycosyltransferase